MACSFLPLLSSPCLTRPWRAVYFHQMSICMSWRALSCPAKCIQLPFPGVLPPYPLYSSAWPVRGVISPSPSILLPVPGVLLPSPVLCCPCPWRAPSFPATYIQLPVSGVLSPSLTYMHIHLPVQPLACAISCLCLISFMQECEIGEFFLCPTWFLQTCFFLMLSKIHSLTRPGCWPGSNTQPGATLLLYSTRGCSLNIVSFDD